MDKQLIFTITNGRTGTGFLAKLLGTLSSNEVFVGHEVKPLFDDYLSRAREDPNIFESFWLNKKLPAISKLPQPIYVETSHVCCKGFLQPLLAMNLDVKLIWLMRPHREVAKSMWQLNDIPGRTKTGKRYYLYPGNPKNIHKLRNWEEFSDYQLCYWHCLETQARGIKYQKIYKDIIFPISLEDLKGEECFKELLAFCGLPEPVYWTEYYILRDMKVNQKLGRKRKEEPNIFKGQLGTILGRD